MLDSVFALWQQGRFAEAGQLLSTRKAEAVSQSGRFDYALAVTASRMMQYNSDNTTPLTADVADADTVVMRTLIGGDTAKADEMKNWGQVFLFCTRVAVANGRDFDLCRQAFDWYINRVGAAALDTYYDHWNELVNYFLVQGEVDAADSVNRRAGDVAREYGDTMFLADVRSFAGLVAFNRQQYEQATDEFIASVGLFEQLDNPSQYEDYGATLGYVVSICSLTGDYGRAVPYALKNCRECLAHYGEQSEQYATAVFMLGRCSSICSRPPRHAPTWGRRSPSPAGCRASTPRCAAACRSSTTT